MAAEPTNIKPDEAAHDEAHKATSLQSSEPLAVGEASKMTGPLASEEASVPAQATPRRPRFVRRPLLAALLCSLVALSALLWFQYRHGSFVRLRKELDKASESVRERLHPPDPYTKAVELVEEERGEPVGRQASIEIPPELKQYADSRRFLAIQAAAAMREKIRPPHDDAELAALISAGGQLVEVPKLGDGYVLYGVGLQATDALTHFDAAAERSVALFAGEPELEAERARLAAEGERLKSEIKELSEHLKNVERRDTTTRAGLQTDIKARRKELSDIDDADKLLAHYYGTASERQALFAERAELEKLAGNFGGQTFNLADANSVRAFKARMLSFVRPPTLAMIEEIGRAYQEKFERPLPITSLIRTEEYQRRLREAGNPNATGANIPPHSTGLAFDIFYHYMTATEQEFVMSELASLERAGRVEALRELRDHYHVFVFVDAGRPDDKLVERAMHARSIEDPKAKGSGRSTEESKTGRTSETDRASKATETKNPQAAKTPKATKTPPAATRRSR